MPGFEDAHAILRVDRPEYPKVSNLYAAAVASLWYLLLENRFAIWVNLHIGVTEPTYTCHGTKVLREEAC